MPSHIWPYSKSNAQTTLTYGPYRTKAKAAIHCCQFIASVHPGENTSSLGVLWIEAAGIDVLRLPVFASDTGLGETIIIEWHGTVMPKPETEPSGLNWTSIENAVSGFYARIGRGVHEFSQSLDQQSADLTKQLNQPATSFGEQMYQQSLMEQEASVQMWMGLRGAYRTVEHWLTDHPVAATGLAMALDAVGVVGSAIGIIALLPEAGAVAIGLAAAAGISSVALLGADGYDEFLRVSADRAATLGDANKALEDAYQIQSLETSDTYRTIQLLAPLIALPDAGRGIYSAGKEIATARTALSSSEESLQAARIGATDAAGKFTQAKSKGNVPKPQLKDLRKQSNRAAYILKKANELNDQRKGKLKLALQQALYRPAAKTHELPVSLTLAGIDYTGWTTPLLVKGMNQPEVLPNVIDLSGPQGAGANLLPDPIGHSNAKSKGFLSFKTLISTKFGQPGG